MMSTALAIGIAVGAAVIAAVISFRLGISYRKKIAESSIKSAEEEAKRIVNDSYKTIENMKKEKLLEVKDEIHKSRAELDKEIKERRGEIQKQEKRLLQKEENLDKKIENLEKREETLKDKQKKLEEKEEYVAEIQRRQLELLEKISGLTAEEAKYHPRKNVLMRALGANDPIEIDIFDVDTSIKGVFLCSDGLTNMLTEEQIEKILNSDLSIEDTIVKLIRKANSRGGNDNITIAYLKKESGDL